MPADYNLDLWRYLPKFDAPKSFTSQKISELDNERIRILRPIYEPLSSSQTVQARKTTELGQEFESDVAGERAAGRYDLQRSAGSADWYMGNDRRGREYGEFGRRAVEGDAGCAGQIRPQNRNRRSDLAEPWDRLHEGREPHRQPEDRAVPVGSSGKSCAVEVPVRGLHQPAGRCAAIVTTEGVQLDEPTVGGQFEEGALLVAAIPRRGPVEVAVRGLNQRPGRSHADIRRKTMRTDQRAGGSDFNQHSTIDSAAVLRSGIKVPIRGLHESTRRRVSVSAKVVEWREHAGEAEGKGRAIYGSPALLGGPVKQSISSLDHRAYGSRAIGPREAMQHSKISRRSDAEDRACFP